LCWFLQLAFLAVRSLKGFLRPGMWVGALGVIAVIVGIVWVITKRLS
jgi:hypothetical protein